jgi:hypothetical protein
MIAENVSSFTIRWVALYVRKRAHGLPAAMRELDQFVRLPGRKHLVTSLDCAAIPAVTGLYWLKSADSHEKLYVGKALDLRQRFQLQLANVKFDFWGTSRQNLELRYRAFPDVDRTFLDGNQCRWIADWNPIGNYSDFAAV